MPYLRFSPPALISFGGFCVSLAFKKAYQTVGPLVLGVALIALGFYVLPPQETISQTSHIACETEINGLEMVAVEEV